MIKIAWHDGAQAHIKNNGKISNSVEYGNKLNGFICCICSAGAHAFLNDRDYFCRECAYDYYKVKGLRLKAGLSGLILLLIKYALNRSNYKQRAAAKVLRVSPRMLNYHIKKYGIKHDSYHINKG